MDDMDQVLVVIAQKLQKFLPLVGGPDCAHSLIPLFEALCETEEITVRDAVVESICHVLKQLSGAHNGSIAAFSDFFKRIASEDSGDSFYGRVSSCFLVTDVYKIVPNSDKQVVREVFARLCRDELPIVRRAASKQFKQLMKEVDNDILVSEFLPLLKTLSGDESQSIQVFGIEAIVPFGELLKSHSATKVLSEELLPMVRTYTDSTSWRNRQSMARDFGKLSKVFLPAEVTSEVFNCLVHLILDPEPEVRQLGIQEVLPFLDVVDTPQFIGEWAPAALQLVQDPMANVRKMLAELSVDVAAKVGPEAVAQHISELIIKLIEDEDPMVRLRIIKKLPIIAEEAPSLCTRLTEYLVAYFSHTNWRVRKELLIAMPSIVKHMGRDYFVDHFQAPMIALLTDGVDEVRTMAAVSVANITDASGEEYGYETLFPELKKLCTSEYLLRLSSIGGLEGLLKIDKLSDKFHTEAVQLLVKLVDDVVPNVRIRAAQALRSVTNLPHLSSFSSQLQPCLQKLQSDKDRDVKYFSGSGQ